MYSSVSLMENGWVELPTRTKNSSCLSPFLRYAGLWAPLTDTTQMSLPPMDSNAAMTYLANVMPIIVLASVVRWLSKAVAALFGQGLVVVIEAGHFSRVVDPDQEGAAVGIEERYYGLQHHLF